MENENKIEHYYGDIVRNIFIVAGIIMVVMLPFFSSLIKVPITLSIVAILALAIFAGFLNPKQLWIIVSNSIISIVACAVFEYYAVTSYLNLDPSVSLNVRFFWVNQFLAILFFVAIYLSVKSFRGKIV